MKKILSLLIILSFVLSMLGGLIVYGATSDAVYVLGTSFEDSDTLSWSSYHGTDEAGKNESYITDKNHSDGNKSLYILDTVGKLTGKTSGRYSIERGTYKLTADAYILSGSVEMYIRFYEKAGSGAYKQKKYTISENDGFTKTSFTYTTPEKTEEVQILLLSSSAKGEGYIDNVVLEKIAPYDTTLYTLCDVLDVGIDSYNGIGGTILLPDGTYNGFQYTVNASGTKDSPLIIKAQNPGKVVFTGDSSFDINGNYVKLQGLRFENVTSTSIVTFSSKSSNSEINDCAFYNCDPVGDDSQRQNWVSISGSFIKVSDCFFSGKSSYAQMIAYSKTIPKGGTLDDLSHDNHIIENCYFGNIKQQTTNGYETIRMGSSTVAFFNSKSLVEGCFFYRCDGEDEMVSVKSCENEIRYNTFYDSNGGVVFRHGDRNQAYGNLFIGGKNKGRTTGVRIIGEDHKVYDNYFYNMSDKSPIINIYHGNPYEGIENHWYYPVKNVAVYNNTFIGGDRHILVGGYAPNDSMDKNRIIAPDGSIYNNIILSQSGLNPMIVNGDPTDLSLADTTYNKVEFTNNYAYGKDVGYKENDGVTKSLVKLIKDEEFIKPLDTTLGADLDGVKKAPTSPFDIISDWVKSTYYDTGLVTFERVENDPFVSGSHINKLVSFDVKASVNSEGGSVQLYKDDVAVLGNETNVSGNPTMKIVATPDEYKEVSGWYLDNIELNESNMSAFGIKKSNNPNELIIDDVINSYDIKAVFSDISTPPSELSGIVSKFKGKVNNGETVKFKNQNNEEESISGNYIVLLKRIPIINGSDLREYGIMVYFGKKDKTEIVPSMLPLSTKGAYGMVLYNLNAGEYTIKPYAVYDGTTIYGQEETITIEE